SGEAQAEKISGGWTPHVPVKPTAETLTGFWSWGAGAFLNLNRKKGTYFAWGSAATARRKLSVSDVFCLSEGYATRWIVLEHASERGHVAKAQPDDCKPDDCK